VRKYKYLSYAFVLVFLLCGCDVVSHNLNFESTKIESNSGIQIVSESAKGEACANNSETQDERLKINSVNVYDLDEINIKYNFYISNLSVYKSKTLPYDVPVEFFQYFDIDQVSENGKLLNKTSYVFITLDAQNMADEPILFTWNAMLIFAADLEGYLISDDTLTSWEMRYRSGEQQKEKPRDYYVESLEPQEKVSVTIGYIIDDRYIDNSNNELYFSPFSAFTGDRFDKLPVYKISNG